jgi:single-strand DNA-binding protein
MTTSHGELMFDTQVALVGNVMTAPEWRRTSVTKTLVANFKVASSSRRYDRESGRWVDGPSLRVRVTCWRRLAEGVASSVMVGDPVIVTGRMFTRDWVAEDGTKRTSYELEAFAVGHDLARGIGKFSRTRLNTATSSVENAESDARIAGEASEPVDVPMAPPEDFNPFDDDYLGAELGLELPHTALDADTILREAVALEGFVADPGEPGGTGEPGDPGEPGGTGEPGDPGAPGGTGDDDGSRSGEERPDSLGRTERGRRGRSRVSVPA